MRRERSGTVAQNPRRCKHLCSKDGRRPRSISSRTATLTSSRRHRPTAPQRHSTISSRNAHRPFPTSHAPANRCILRSKPRLLIPPRATTVQCTAHPLSTLLLLHLILAIVRSVLRCERNLLPVTYRCIHDNDDGQFRRELVD